jgi:hypothetical protein
MLDYDALMQLANDSAKKNAALLYPPGAQRDLKEKELAQRYYRQMAYPMRGHYAQS